MGNEARARVYLIRSGSGAYVEVRLANRAEVLAATGWTMPAECDRALLIKGGAETIALAGNVEQIADVLARWQVEILKT